MSAEKRTLRKNLRDRLRALPPERWQAAGAEITRRVWTIPEVAHADTLLLFASLPAEVPTAAIAQEAAERRISVAYPRCVPPRKLALHRVESLDELRPGRYGIREPDPACPPVAAGDIDAALVPGLAWDRSGARLGRGGGYYDRLFARPEWRGLRCGLFLSVQEVPRVPTDPWDMPLDAVVTEHEVRRFRPPHFRRGSG